jgi:hypothetical protein
MVNYRGSKMVVSKAVNHKRAVELLRGSAVYFSPDRARHSLPCVMGTIAKTCRSHAKLEVFPRTSLQANPPRTMTRTADLTHMLVPIGC